MGVPREAWRVIEIKIRNYPAMKKEYDEYIESIMAASSGSSVIIDNENKPQSVVEAKALKMNSVYYERLKKEIEAVEYAYNTLSDNEKRVMSQRYWTDRKRNIPYLKMHNVYYSERTCKRIIFKVIVLVGKYLGEIK